MQNLFFYPTLLPDKCEFSKLLIDSVHKKNCHVGIRIMQTLIRENLWIIRARKTTMNVWYNCITYKRFKVKYM